MKSTPPNCLEMYACNFNTRIWHSLVLFGIFLQVLSRGGRDIFYLVLLSIKLTQFLFCKKNKSVYLTVKMFCSVLFCSVLFCSVLFCSVLFGLDTHHAAERLRTQKWFCKRIRVGSRLGMLNLSKANHAKGG